MTDDYMEYISLSKKLKFIREDKVPLAALKNELKRMKDGNCIYQSIASYTIDNAILETMVLV